MTLCECKNKKKPPIPRTIQKIAAGYGHTCSVLSDGNVKCWGANWSGQLGNGGQTGLETCGVFCSTTPVYVNGLSNATDITAGASHTCALTSSGGLKCWGHNYYGQLGIGSNTGPQTCGPNPCSAIPVNVSGLSEGVIAITAGWEHTCALINLGTIKCWGWNDSGQVGYGNSTGLQTCSGSSCSTNPVDVTGLTTEIITLDAGDEHVCALTNSGTLKCWGSNEYGELGIGSSTGPQTCKNYTPCGTVPTDVSNLGDIKAIAAGGRHTCALSTYSTVKCWGYNESGQLGTDKLTNSEVCSGFSCSTAPVDVRNLKDVIAITTGWAHSCALVVSGGVKCWGYNIYGQLGDATTTDSSVPVDVSGLTSGVTAITAGQYHTCALTTSGKVKCWGQNWFGQLGNSTTSSSTTPVDVSSALYE